jgi:hypothetical protein
MLSNSVVDEWLGFAFQRGLAGSISIANAP